MQWTGGGGVKERKYVSVQANQDKATDEKKSQKWKKGSNKIIREGDFVTSDNKDSGFGLWGKQSDCNRKLEIM